jgi:hypothetical protein
MSKPVPANKFNLFMQGEITFEEMTGEPEEFYINPKFKNV